MLHKPDSGAVGVDGRQSWAIVKINNVSCITVLFCDQDVRVIFTWTCVVQVPANKSTALLI